MLSAFATAGATRANATTMARRKRFHGTRLPFYARRVEIGCAGIRGVGGGAIKELARGRGAGANYELHITKDKGRSQPWSRADRPFQAEEWNEAQRRTSNGENRGLARCGCDPPVAWSGRPRHNTCRLQLRRRAPSPYPLPQGEEFAARVGFPVVRHGVPDLRATPAAIAVFSGSGPRFANPEPCAAEQRQLNYQPSPVTMGCIGALRRYVTGRGFPGFGEELVGHSGFALFGGSAQLPSPIRLNRREGSTHVFRTGR